MMKLLFGAAIGAAVAWFLDPNDGPRRRTVAREKAGRYARQGKDQAARQATYAGQTLKGKATAAVPGSGREPAAQRLNDPALQAKIESEVFREAGVSKEKVSVNVEGGIAYLRGELEDTAVIERLREATEKVDGIQGVESLLHTPGEPAPTKDTAGKSA